MIRPLADRIVVKPLPEEKVSAGGIAIPDTAAEKPLQGRIVAVGKGKRNKQGRFVPLDCRPGDLIAYGHYAGQAVRVEGEEFIIMQEADIVGFVDDRPGDGLPVSGSS